MNPIPIISNSVPVATPTNFQDNIRSGVVQFPGGNSNSPGVMIGNLQAYAVKPNAAADVTNPIVDPSGLISLTSSVNAPFSVVDQKITFDVCRGLKLAATTADPYSWVISGYDFYNEKMVWSGNAAGNVAEVFSPRGFNAICSVSITQAEGATGTFTLSTRDSIELPYADWNADNVLIVNYAEQPLMWLRPGDGTLSYSVFAFQYNYSNPVQTGTTGNPRPLITLDPTEYTGTPPFNAANVLVVLQSILGAGFNIPATENVDRPSVAQNAQPYLNDKEYVIGTPSFAEGWQGFVS